MWKNDWAFDDNPVKHTQFLWTLVSKPIELREYDVFFVCFCFVVFFGGSGEGGGSFANWKDGDPYNIQFVVTLLYI